MRKKLNILLAVTLVAACMMSMSVSAVSFNDVNEHWAETYIAQAADRELIQGYNGLYRPDDPMTRAELVTVLWRAMGQPEPTAAADFTDLAQDWYKKPVAWAQESNVVNGVGNGKFDPNGHVTREQLVVILHRLAGTPVSGEVLLTSIYDWQYPDSGEISAYAKQALYWSIYNVIYCGEASLEVGKTLEPTEDATRGQIAVMMIRYLDRNN